METEFEIINLTDQEVKEINLIKPLLDYALKEEHLNAVIFNVLLVDNNKIHELNKEYRGVDQVTDVITFALEDADDFKSQEFRLLGDIYISIDKARAQASEYGHSFARELCFLAIHGFYHLLGFDHMNEADEKIMFERQERILNGFGITR